MENEKNIEKTTRLEPRSVLLIDGRGDCHVHTAIRYDCVAIPMPPRRSIRLSGEQSGTARNVGG